MTVVMRRESGGLISRLQLKGWRREWDSNPRYGFCPYNALAGRPLRPLGHHSAGSVAAYAATHSGGVMAEWPGGPVRPESEERLTALATRASRTRGARPRIHQTARYGANSTLLSAPARCGGLSQTPTSPFPSGPRESAAGEAGPLIRKPR